MIEQNRVLVHKETYRGRPVCGYYILPQISMTGIQEHARKTVMRSVQRQKDRIDAEAEDAATQ